VTQSSTAVTTRTQSSIGGFQTGVDLYADDNWSAGLYTGMLNHHADVTGLPASGALPAGRAKGNSYYLGSYATYANADRFYTDLVLQYGMHDMSPTAAGALATSSNGVSGHSVTASVEVGQAFALGSSDWTVEPQAQLILQRSSMGGAAIEGATVSQEPGNAVIGRLGVRVKGDFATSYGRLQPYGRLNLWHGFSGHDTTRFAGPAATTTVETSFGYTSLEAAAGLTWKLTPTTSVYGEIGRTFKTSHGDAQLKASVQGSVGVKWNF